MAERTSFDYAVLRIVPRVDREEFLNAGLLMFCLAHKFLDARVHVDAALVRAFAPGLDVDAAWQHLQAFPKICSGDPNAGPVARLTLRQRFHWMTAPRSTIIQVSAVHCGMCDSPSATFEQLFQQLVLRQDSAGDVPGNSW